MIFYFYCLPCLLPPFLYHLQRIYLPDFHYLSYILIYKLFICRVSHIIEIMWYLNLGVFIWHYSLEVHPFSYKMTWTHSSLEQTSTALCVDVFFSLSFLQSHVYKQEIFSSDSFKTHIVSALIFKLFCLQPYGTGRTFLIFVVLY